MRFCLLAPLLARPPPRPRPAAAGRPRLPAPTEAFLRLGTLRIANNYQWLLGYSNFCLLTSLSASDTSDSSSESEFLRRALRAGLPRPARDAAAALRLPPSESEFPEGLYCIKKQVSRQSIKS